MNITVYCASNPGTNESFRTAAKALGEWIGKSGNDLVYGGSSVGLMGVISRAVLDNGGKVYGVEPRFFIESGVAQHDLTELVVVETMNERKAKMIELGDVFVALPGGIGTLEEITEVMTRIRLNLTSPPCFLVNLDGFYDPLHALIDTMVRNELMPGFQWSDYQFVNDIDTLISKIEGLDPNRTVVSSESDWKQPDWVSTEACYG